jgi:hypothetical protein
MKFHKFSFFFFFCLCAAGYGDPQLTNQPFYTEGESINLIETGFNSVNVKARIEWIAETGMDQEIIYHPRKKKVSRRDVELKDNILHFHRGGEYLIEFIREDQTKEIRKIKVVSNYDSVMGADPFKDIHLYAFRDAFYKTIFHLELRFRPYENARTNVQKGDLGLPLNMSWEISGGRHHILDDALPYFSKIRAFQKSVVLKEFGSYEAKARLNFPDGRILEKSVKIDLRPTSQEDLHFQTEAVSYTLNQPVFISVQNQSRSHIQHETPSPYAWVVKTVHRSDCPQEWLEFENADDPNVRGILHYICDNGYQEELVSGKDFMLPSQDDHQAEFLFKRPGEYEIGFLLFDSGGHVYSAGKKRITLFP